MYYTVNCCVNWDCMNEREVSVLCTAIFLSALKANFLPAVCNYERACTQISCFANFLSLRLVKIFALMIFIRKVWIPDFVFRSN